MRAFDETNLIRAVAFSGDGKRFVTAGESASPEDGSVVGTIRLWDVASADVLIGKTNLCGPYGRLRVALSHDGTQVLSSTYNCTVDIPWEVDLWNAANGELLSGIASTNYMTAVGFSADERQVLVQGSAARTYDTMTGNLIRVFGAEGEYGSFSPDGTVEATAKGFGDGSIGLASFWEVGTGRPAAHCRVLLL